MLAPQKVLSKSLQSAIQIPSPASLTLATPLPPWQGRFSEVLEAKLPLLNSSSTHPSVAAAFVRQRTTTAWLRRQVIQKIWQFSQQVQPALLSVMVLPVVGVLPVELPLLVLLVLLLVVLLLLPVELKQLLLELLLLLLLVELKLLLLLVVVHVQHASER
eukprot:g42014.t1